MPEGLETVLVYFSWAYYGAFIAWWLQVTLIGEKLALQFFFNSLAHLVFLPLPFILVVAAVAANAALLVLGLGAVALWAYIWVGPFLPRWVRRRTSVPDGPVLRVATFNLLWTNGESDGILQAVRSLDADMLGLQELSPRVSRDIDRELAEEYPYRLLKPADRAYGLGLISRLPFDVAGTRIEDGGWLGEPLVVDVKFHGATATVVVFHAAPIGLHSAVRERQARKLVDYAASLDRPVVVMGDLNATSASPATQVLQRGLYDAWNVAGWGFGHTFPGSAWTHKPGGILPFGLRRLIPRWLVRIDYVFVSGHWLVAGARTASRHDGSDHRPLVVDLVPRR